MASSCRLGEFSPQTVATLYTYGTQTYTQLHPRLTDPAKNLALFVPAIYFRLFHTIRFTQTYGSHSANWINTSSLKPTMPRKDVRCWLGPSGYTKFLLDTFCALLF